MRRKSRGSARQPHPDPARELELQRILDLRASIARYAALASQYQQEIKNLYCTAQDETSAKRIDTYLAEAATLHARILETEAAISRVNAEIAALQAQIPADDLAYL